MRYAILLLALLAAGQLVAQQATTTNPTLPTDTTIRPATPATPTTTDPALQPGARRDVTSPSQGPQKVVRVSKIIGINVKNKANEDLGSINDIVLEPADGRVAFAAVSMGGFLGVGDKMFAVPWEALECREVNGEHVAVLDIDKQRLENAQGFDEEHWPDMANEQWRMTNDRPYRLQRPQGHEVFKPAQPGSISQPGTTQPGTSQPGKLPGTQPRPAQPSAPLQPQQ